MKRFIRRFPWERRVVRFLKNSAVIAGSLAFPSVIRSAETRTLTVAIPSNPATFDPINQNNHDAMVVNQLIFENLIEIDGAGRRQPMLAKALPSVTQDGLRYVFDLREDVTFQNGQPFTAEDVKYSYDYILDPANKAVRRAVWTPIEAIDVLGKHQVQFRLKTPYRPMLDYMTKYMGIFPVEVAKRLQPRCSNSGRKGWEPAPASSSPPARTTSLNCGATRTTGARTSPAGMSCAFASYPRMPRAWRH